MVALRPLWFAFRSGSSVLKKLSNDPGPRRVTPRFFCRTRFFSDAWNFLVGVIGPVLVQLFHLRFLKVFDGEIPLVEIPLRTFSLQVRIISLLLFPRLTEDRAPRS